MLASTWIEDLGCLSVATEDDVGGVDARGAGAKENEGGARMTIISSLSMVVGVSLSCKTGALVDANGPPRKGLKVLAEASLRYPYFGPLTRSPLSGCIL